MQFHPSFAKVLILREARIDKLLSPTAPVFFNFLLFQLLELLRGLVEFCTGFQLAGL
jgi:hypothetical protein